MNTREFAAFAEGLVRHGLNRYVADYVVVDSVAIHDDARTFMQIIAIYYTLRLPDDPQGRTIKRGTRLEVPGGLLSERGHHELRRVIDRLAKEINEDALSQLPDLLWAEPKEANHG